ncbi:MAG: glycosyltransferase family 1 protein [bacterium]|nr:glycosyltransferase family 1 protein [bacterium]
MKIGFDAKRIFNNQTGLGNYSRGVVKSLVTQFPENEYHLYSPGICIYPEYLLDQTEVFRHGPTTTFHKKFPSIWRSRALVKDLEAQGIELYHGLSNELPVGIEKTGIKSVVTIHDLIFLHYPNLYPFFDRKVYQKKFAAAVNLANIVIATSEHTKADIIKAYDCNPAQVKVVYQDCDAAFAQRFSQEELAALKRKYGLTRDYVLSVGTLEQRKNHLNLLKAFVKSDLHDIDLVLVGKKGDAYTALEKYIKENSLEARIKFIHELPFQELPKMYQAAKVFAYISRYEGFGIPILEALHAQLPVLASNSSSLPEVGGTAVYYVEPDSIQEISFGLNQLIYNQTKREELLCAIPTQLQLFESAKLGKQLMEIYQSLIV